MAYPLGTLVELTGTFENQNGVPADPTQVTLFVAPPKTPVGQSTAYIIPSLVRVSTGVYTFNLYLDTPGTWTYCWEGTGAVEAATFDIPINVTPSKLRST